MLAAPDKYIVDTLKMGHVVLINTTTCAAGTEVIDVHEQDFSATYDVTTNSWTAMWKWSQGIEPGILKKQDPVVEEGTSSYIDDILVDVDIVKVNYVEQHLARYDLATKTPERVADGARVLGLRVWEQDGKLY
ncbi:hypothetical protein Pmani_022746 [Petrolisthes manimaculis]|uniref:Uncharacterized protein n=1 Tax=Petrolisthes manimaculis TaxID=1843537 RepID=A0AAE1PDW6_9EUCA|nr:hypothetical protein Pmani_022746 [Petrolisthes manimaculis]